MINKYMEGYEMKKNIKKTIAALAVPGALALALAGCAGLGGSSAGENSATAETTAAESTATAVNTTGSENSGNNASANAVSKYDGFTDRDFDSSYPDYQEIKLATGATGANADGVTVDGNTVTFTKAGTYLLSGELQEGQLVVDLPGENDKIQLVLDGVNVTNSNSAALYVKNADKVFVTTASGTENSISATGEFVQTDDNNVDGAVYSKDDIVFNGEGILKVASAAGHGIVSKNDLKITGGTIEVTSASKALQGKDMVGIAGGTVNLDAGTDGIDSVNVALYEGSVNIKAADEGINSDVTDENTDPVVLLAGAALNIEAGDDAVQSTGDVTLSGGTVKIVSGGGSVNAAEHYDDMAFGQMGGWPGRGQQGPRFGGEQSNTGEINFDTDDDSSAGEGTKNKGIKAANIYLKGGVLDIDAQDDALNADGEILVEDGTYDIVAGDDGLHASEKVTVNKGVINVEAWEGLEATIVTINDGEITISANDDGINATQKVSSLSPAVEINGGNITINMAQGDTDALDSNGTLYINGGTVNINAQFPFDYDGDGAIKGGTVYVNGEQITEIYNQFMGGGMQSGPGGQMPGVQGGMPGGQV